jgi:hypothetical protein
VDDGAIPSLRAILFMNIENKSSTYWQDQFRAYVEKRRKEGMIGMHISLIPPSDGSTLEIESVCEEFMRAVNAETVPDHEVLGKYSK